MNKKILLVALLSTLALAASVQEASAVTVSAPDAQSGITGFNLSAIAGGNTARGAFVGITGPTAVATVPLASTTAQIATGLGSTDLTASTTSTGAATSSNSVNGGIVGAFTNNTDYGSNAIAASITGGATSGTVSGTGLNGIAVGQQVSSASSAAGSSVSSTLNGGGSSSVGSTVKTCGSSMGLAAVAGTSC